MIVARQFIAWYAGRTTAVPLGYGVMGFEERGCATMASPVAHLGIPWQRSYRPDGTDPFSTQFQAINCLATITQSRDAHSPHRPFAHTLHPRLHLRFVLFLYLRRHQLQVGPIRCGLVLEDAMVQIFTVTGPQRLGLD